MKDDIDIVIPWVDPSDSVWQKEKNKYMGIVTDEEDARDIRYRDWDNLQYVFRSIEKYAPWVRKVHFITYGHLPKWLNVNSAKLNIVKHEEYIPKQYLPTFSSHVIELNMNRIPGLSEKFIYLNDDIFFIKQTKPTDFFLNDLPCDCNTANLVIPTTENFMPIVFNCVACINKHFNKRKSIKKDIFKWINPKFGVISNLRTIELMPWPMFTGFKNYHVAVSYLKSTLDEVWSVEGDILDETCKHKFRDNRDVNQYLFRFWQIAGGKFNPHKQFGKYFKIGNDNTNLIKYIKKRKGLMVCINDDDFNGDFELIKSQINMNLNLLFPEKSSFEI